MDVERFKDVFVFGLWFKGLGDLLWASLKLVFPFVSSGTIKHNGWPNGRFPCPDVDPRSVITTPTIFLFNFGQQKHRYFQPHNILLVV